MKKFFVGVKGLITDEKRGLLLLECEGFDGPAWEAPGGRIEDDETFEQTLVRELGEELIGVTDVAVKELLGVERINRDIELHTGLILLYFRVEATVPDPIVLSDEHTAFRWLSKKDNMPKNCDPVLKSIIQKWQNTSD